jgi:DNA-binding transcriptional LysR family regulator
MLSIGSVPVDALTKAVPKPTDPMPASSITRSGAARLADQAHSDWVLPHDGFACAEMVKRACGAAGFQPSIVAEATDFSVQLQLVAAGIGVALVPRLAARGLPEGLQLLPVHPAVGRHHFALARRSARSDAGIRRIVDLLKHNALRVLDESLPAMATPSPNEAH